ncbi:MAG: hypothetical protein BWX70_02072 [Verrucomicrobia bacterium ADurb.Bin070]|nr:MAG: hypothetical protein BWX70_02072 [Verrucomicrobia bacterium ADurb.Bin070]
MVIGFLISLPTSDQVPELMISAFLGFLTGAAANALAVSCEPTAIRGTSFRPQAAASLACSAPMRVPGRTISGISFLGMPSAFSISRLHLPFFASIICVTLAKVESTAVHPPR